MEIFRMDTPNGTFNNAIRMTKPIDDNLILQAAQLAFEYNIDFDLDTLRDEIYKTNSTRIRPNEKNLSLINNIRCLRA